ncbi:MAG TPA: serine hydrolase [Desulfitobacteriaceae bacterium]|nr:serine hydrolase [Desulfitobacteriaceae bacterium]
MKKTIRITLITIGSVLAALLLLVAVSCIVYTPEYIYRCIVNGEGKTSDYLFFPERTIEKSTRPYQYEYMLKDNLADIDVSYTMKGQLLNQPLDTLAKSTGTTSLLVIHQDKVVYEEYFNGHDAGSVNTSFSAVKSIVSLMIGMAIEDGFIQSEEQPVSTFISELDGTEFANITIKELLMMRSKIAYHQGNFWILWFGDGAKTYYYPDLRALALTSMRVDPDYGGEFHYNNYHPLLLGIILERSTGMSVSEYFRTKIWDKVGAENNASWSLDSDKSGFEKMESGLNFKSIDFAKIGSMLINRGHWNGSTIINEEWLNRSIVAAEPMNESGIGYQYMWYSFANEKGGYDYFAHGNHGQYLYISPESETVIVRTGTEEGIDTWIVPLYEIAAYIGSSAN